MFCSLENWKFLTLLALLLATALYSQQIKDVAREVFTQTTFLAVNIENALVLIDPLFFPDHLSLIYRRLESKFRSSSNRLRQSNWDSRTTQINWKYKIDNYRKTKHNRNCSRCYSKYFIKCITNYCHSVPNLFNVPTICTSFMVPTTSTCSTAINLIQIRTSSSSGSSCSSFSHCSSLQSISFAGKFQKKTT